jgi:hypothetical protein
MSFAKGNNFLDPTNIFLLPSFLPAKERVVGRSDDRACKLSAMPPVYLNLKGTTPTIGEIKKNQY